jgi:hypothetical protein
MAESAPEFVPLAHVQAILELFVARQSTEGLTPERITSGGEAIYVCHGAKPAADSAMFLVKLAAAYAGNGGDARLVAAMYPKLCRTLSTVPRDVQTGLVWIDPASPHTAYGFTDTIAITGYHLFCSLLLMESSAILARFAKQLKRDDDARRYAADGTKIRGALDRLWSAEDRLYVAGTKDCRQPDIWGSAYACTIGALNNEKCKAVADSLWEQRDQFRLRAQVRHLPAPQYWERLIVNEDWTGPGKFQNGAYWGTASGWVAEAFELRQKGAGIAVLCDLVNDFNVHGVWECIGPGGYQRIANNVSSACLPYASLKRLMK